MIIREKTNLSGFPFEVEGVKGIWEEVEAMMIFINSNEPEVTIIYGSRTVTRTRDEVIQEIIELENYGQI